MERSIYLTERSMGASEVIGLEVLGDEQAASARKASSSLWCSTSIWLSSGLEAMRSGLRASRGDRRYRGLTRSEALENGIVGGEMSDTGGDTAGEGFFMNGMGDSGSGDGLDCTELVSVEVLRGEGEREDRKCFLGEDKGMRGRE